MPLVQPSLKRRFDNVAGGAGTISFSHTANFGAGNTAIIPVRHFQGGTGRITSITVDGVLAVKVFDSTSADGFVHTERWRASNLPGTSANVVINTTAGQNGNFVVLSVDEWNDISLTNPDGPSQVVGQTTSNLPGGISTRGSRQSNTLVYTGFADYVGSAWATAVGQNGFVTSFVEPDINTAAGAEFYKVVSQIGNQEGRALLGAAAQWIGGVTVFNLTTPGDDSITGNHSLDLQGVSSPSSDSAVFDSPSTGVLLAVVGRGVATNFNTATISDNKGNTLAPLGPQRPYTAFPGSAVQLYADLTGAGGAGHVVSTSKPTNTDETTLATIFVKNHDTLIDHNWVERASAATVTSLPITTTGPATLVCFWFGDSVNGELNPVPGAGWAKMNWSSRNTADHIQFASATRVVTGAGTYTCDWTPLNAQGAQIFMIALSNAGGLAITSQPANTTVAPGASAVFTVGATGATGFQWQKRDAAGAWNNVAGATASTYNTPPVAVADNGSTYRCLVSNGVGSATSLPATSFLSGQNTGRGTGIMDGFAFRGKARNVETFSLLRKPMPFGNAAGQQSAILRDWFALSGASTAATIQLAAGIASAETFGVATLSSGLTVINAGGIASAEAFGAPTLLPGVTVTNAGAIPSAEAFGGATVSGATSTTISNAGAIPSAEAFGGATLAVGTTLINVGGIPSAEAFGAPVMAQGTTVSNAGAIASAEAFGVPVVAQIVTVSNAGAIPSAEAFGVPVLALGTTISNAGAIPSGEAFDVPNLGGGTSTTISNAGAIPSAEAFGGATLALGTTLTNAGGIPSAEAFGVPVVAQGTTVSGAGAIASAEAFGVPVVAQGTTVSNAGAIPSAEAFGVPVLALGTTISNAGAIPSAEAFGLATIGGATSATISNAGAIPSAEAFGGVTLAVGATLTNAGGIPSAEAFGVPVVAQGTTVSNAGAIPSAEAFGVPIVTGATANQIVGAGGIPSGEAFGTPNVTGTGGTTEQPGGGFMPRVFGVPIKRNQKRAQPIAAVIEVDGIPSAEAFGIPTVTGTPGETREQLDARNARESAALQAFMADIHAAAAAQLTAAALAVAAEERAAHQRFIARDDEEFLNEM